MIVLSSSQLFTPSLPDILAIDTKGKLFDQCLSIQMNPHIVPNCLEDFD